MAFVVQDQWQVARGQRVSPGVRTSDSPVGRTARTVAPFVLTLAVHTLLLLFLLYQLAGAHGPSLARGAPARLTLFDLGSAKTATAAGAPAAAKPVPAKAPPQPPQPVEAPTPPVEWHAVKIVVPATVTTPSQPAPPAAGSAAATANAQQIGSSTSAASSGSAYDPYAGASLKARADAMPANPTAASPAGMFPSALIGRLSPPPQAGAASAIDKAVRRFGATHPAVRGRVSIRSCIAGDGRLVRLEVADRSLAPADLRAVEEMLPKPDPAASRLACVEQVSIRDLPAR